jgi:hypothetical protein
MSNTSQLMMMMMMMMDRIGNYTVFMYLKCRGEASTLTHIFNLMIL